MGYDTPPRDTLLENLLEKRIEKHQEQLLEYPNGERLAPHLGLLVP